MISKLIEHRKNAALIAATIRCTAGVVLFALLPTPVLAQSSIPELHAGVFPAAPFAMQENQTLTGFSIELWTQIAARLQVKSDYTVSSDTASLLQDVRSKKLDIIVTPVFITSPRDAEFDFSYPVTEAGLGILVRDVGDTARPPNPLQDLLRLLLSPAILVWLGIAILLILIPAHLIWFLDRRSTEGVTHGERYFPGIFHAMIWAATALVSQVQELPNQWLARVIAVVWMFAGVVFVAFYTAQLTATLTVQKIRSNIAGPADLPGKPVATLAKSTAADYLRARKALVYEFPTPERMFQALLQKKVDAVVAAAPFLLYYAAHDGKGFARMVGPQFNVAPAAMLFQLGSPLRKKVNGALISLREDGTYDQIYEKWFGPE